VAAAPAGFAERVARIADELLFERALEVDARAEIPAGHLVALAEAGLFAIAGPTEFGGLDLDARTQRRVRETLASGCLTTAFVWAQHQGVVRRLRNAPPATQAAWLPDLCAGRALGGLVLAGLLPARQPLLRIAPSHDGFTISGSAPAVSGWGHVSVLLVIARPSAGEVAYVLVDPNTVGLHVHPRTLAAVNGTRTVALEFHTVRVPASALVHTEPLPPWAAVGDGVRANGAFSIGVADRCARLCADEPWMAAEVAARRAALDDAADGEALARARADAALFAARAASLLVSARGSGGLDLRDHAQRLAREAIFLLAFGQRPAIRSALLEGLR
jgi:alkylation response protein AidB-like acyl-CoA dehydrogenase